MADLLSSIKLVRLHDSPRLPGAFDGREDGRRFRLRVVVPIEQILNKETALAVIHRDRPEGVDGWRILLVPYQNQILSRPGCGVGVGLPSLYSYGFFPGPGTSAIGINSGGKAVLTC